jgi:hypothetical protein
VLNSKPAREFYAARIFWDAKRPITVEVLRQLNIGKLVEGENASPCLRRKQGEIQER